MGLLDSIFGSDSKVESTSTLSPDQQKLLSNIINNNLTPGLKSGASLSNYSAFAETPALLKSAFDTAGGLFGVGQSAIIDALTRQTAAQPAYTFNPGATTRRFEQTFAQPLMASWRENVLPVVRESFNIPGLAHSSVTARGVSDSANRFYGESIAPQLFNALQTDYGYGVQSLENAAGRQLGAATTLAQLPSLATQSAVQLGSLELQNQERILAALRGEESRLFAENNPFLNMGLQAALSSTQETVATQGQQGILGQVAGTAALGGINKAFGLGLF